MSRQGVSMSKKKGNGINYGRQHDKTNLFGGKNARGLYVPMSEDEQEVIHRLVEGEDLVLIIHGWGTLNRPRFLVGDHRIGVQFRLTFNRPATPIDVWFFDLELKTRTGISLVKERLPVMYDGKPVQVCAGMFLDMQWDIALHSMDPRLVKLLKPGAIGLTSRRQDKDTGEMTAQGNMKLDSNQKRALAELEASQAAGRAENTKQVIEATEKAGYKVTKTKKGAKAEDL
jgi:hypothetical protein